jgi:CO dehydrogenase/acetyl-CoA synthase alpha subunit
MDEAFQKRWQAEIAERVSWAESRRIEAEEFRELQERSVQSTREDAEKKSLQKMIDTSDAGRLKNLAHLYWQRKKCNRSGEKCDHAIPVLALSMDQREQSVAVVSLQSDRSLC